MIRSNELNKIDNAIRILINNVGVYEYNKEGIAVDRLWRYIKDNFNGFPINDGASSMIESVDRDVVIKELLKNIVKKQSIIQKKGYATVLGTNKPFDMIHSRDEIEATLYNLISKEDINYIKDLLKKYPNLYSGLAGSFVISRYFSEDFGMDILDDENNINPNDMALLEKIESSYKNVLKHIDFAVNTTQNKLGPNFTAEELFKRLKNYIVNNDASGFTRDNGARDSIKSLTQDEIIKELLKNIVKVGKINGKQGYDTLTEDNPNYDNPEMSLKQSEEYINNLILINQKDINVVLQTLYEHPVLFNGLISSFVTRRYYDARFKALLDVKSLDDEYLNGLYKSIDSYTSDNYGSTGPKM